MANEQPIEILLVEDNPADVFLTQSAFEEVNVQATLRVVRDGEEALAYLRRLGRFAEVAMPDLILLDLNLPRVNGFEVLRELKADAELRHIPVVMLSTSSAREDIHRTYDLHANSYVTKPKNLPKLIDFVHTLEQYWLRAAALPSRSA